MRFVTLEFRFGDTREEEIDSLCARVLTEAPDAALRSVAELVKQAHEVGGFLNGSDTEATSRSLVGVDVDGDFDKSFRLAIRQVDHSLRLQNGLSSEFIRCPTNPAVRQAVAIPGATETSTLPMVCRNLFLSEDGLAPERARYGAGISLNRYHCSRLRAPHREDDLIRAREIQRLGSHCVCGGRDG